MATKHTAKMRDIFVPDEWQTIPELARQISAIVGQTSHAKFKQIVGFLAPFLVGASLAYISTPLDLAAGAVVVRGALTLSGVLAGFMVTLMLFTGRAEKTDSLSLEAAQEYRGKVFYLLWSQTQTLVLSVITAMLALLWLFVAGTKVNFLIDGVTVALFGFLCVSFLRVFLLPFQIFDMHKFALDRMVDEKRLEENKLARKGLGLED